MARKKELKKTGFRELNNCYHRDDNLAGRWHEMFDNQHPTTFELGCGKAAFSYGMAERHPDRNFVGIDLKMDRMWHAARDAQQNQISNLAFVFSHLLQIDECIGPQEADELWITFPDPYPKKRQAKHRMVNPSFLKKYQQVLKPGGMVHYKTDNRALFHYSLEVFVRQGNLRLHQLSFNLHEDETIHSDAKILTHYERQFMEVGKDINYVCFSFTED